MTEVMMKGHAMTTLAVERENQVRLTLPVTGMTCAGCANRVQKRLAAEPGVTSATVNLALDEAVVIGEPGTVSLAKLANSVRETGYGIAEDRIELAISGMTCASCAGRVEKALAAVPNVLGASVNLALETADVRTVRGTVDTSALLQAVTDAGYTATRVEERDAFDHKAEEEAADRRDRIELVLATVLTLPLVAQMVLMVAGVGWHLPVWAEFALATPVQFWIGRRFYGAAWRALKAGAGNMDQLVVLGTTAAWSYSFWLMISQGAMAEGHLYFEASAVIMTLILAGKFMENRAKRSASAALRELMALQPERARVLRGGEEVEVDIGDVGLGEVAIVKPGERIPVDGRIVRGESELDESLITGESVPVLRKAGDQAVAGAVNGMGLLRLRAERIGKDTTLARIARLVSDAQSGKAPIQRLVDRISGIFVPIVLVIALLTLAAWLLTGHTFETSLVAAISVLVIACPCALGLATPTALVAGTGTAARQGILIKDIDTLEQAHHLDLVVFDKTGTLTMGRPEVTEIEAADGNAEGLLKLVASAQTGSEHPLARGILDAARERSLDLVTLDDFKAVAGQGIESELAGRRLRIGRQGFVTSSPATDWEERARSLEEAGRTVVWVASDDEVLGLVALADGLRDDAAATVAALKNKGIEVMLVSGDNQATVKRIAEDVGITRFEAGARPEDKVRIVEQLVADGRHVGMVGDGVNDAPALAAATVGIAMGGGAAVAAEAAGITLMRPKPSLIESSMAIAAKTSQKIRQNLFWAFIYNMIGIPVAALGLLNPAIAGAAMALSSVSVVTNSLLLKRWRPDQDDAR